jgi:hypothetical protein
MFEETIDRSDKDPEVREGSLHKSQRSSKATFSRDFRRNEKI